MAPSKRFWFSLCVIGLAVTSIFIGAIPIDPLHLDASARNIIWISRIPRLIAIILTSMALALSGLIMQKISQNDFVSSNTMMTYDAARLGLLVGLIFGFKTPMRSILAFGFACVASYLFLKFIKRIPTLHPLQLPLIGMILGVIVDAITNMIALKLDLLQTLSTLTSGNFTYIMRGNYELLFLSVLGIGYLCFSIQKFHILGLGESVAFNLGINTKKTQNVGIAVVSMIAAVIVCVIGDIPFVGLVVPNIVRRLFGDGYKGMVFDVCLISIGLVLGCDIIGRLIIFPYELPLQLIMGVVGSVLFMTILWRKRYEMV